MQICHARSGREQIITINTKLQYRSTEIKKKKKRRGGSCGILTGNKEN